MQTMQIWNGYMRCYDFLNGVGSYSAYLQEILDSLNLQPQERVLDAGSGTGNLSVLFRARDADVYSCDFSANAQDIHRQKDPAAKLFNVSLEEPLPFAGGSFDTIVCASVLFTLSQSGCNLALREFQRLLRPGGRLFVTVPAPDHKNKALIRLHLKGLLKRLGLMRGFIRFAADLPSLLRILYYNRCLRRLPDWQGWHLFSERELHTALETAGFAQTSLRRTYGNCFLLAVSRKGKVDEKVQSAEDVHTVSRCL